MSRKKKRSGDARRSESVGAGGALLEIVLKGDGAGTVEAVRNSLHYIHVPGVEVRIIQSGVGPVSKSDLFMARTGSRLVIGFNVGLAPKLENEIRESGVEVRLYDVIYKLSRDVTQICRQMLPKPLEEKIIGSAKVIATFNAPKGMIIGCEVTAGRLEVKKEFRVITAMGPAYFGKIESLQIDGKPVKTGSVGRQVGIHIPDWEKAKVGDLVECFETLKGSNLD